MIKRRLRMLAAYFLLIGMCDSSRSRAQDASQQDKLIGKWTNQNETKGPATINITAVDSATGQLKGEIFSAVRRGSRKGIRRRGMG